MLSVFFAFLVSVLIIQITLSTNRYHGSFSSDNDLHSVQKVHTVPTPRVGGIGVFLSFLAIIIIDHLLNVGSVYGATVSISAILIFIIGTLEDLTKIVTPLIRITVITISAVLAIYVTRALPVITYTDFQGFGHLIARHPIIGISLSLFCAVGLTNAYNIIDGFNGLTSTSAIVNLLGIMFVAIFVHDFTVIKVVGILIASILGFWLFNYPWGKIFLGDGGAYVIGFIIAVISIYIIHEHKGFISPYAILLMAIYPICEIGFSMYRRKFIHHTKCMQPDAMHLHQLVYNRCIPRTIKNRNAMVMPLMLFFIVPQTIFALMFYKQKIVCLLFILLYFMFYVTTYFKIVRFKTPGFLRILLK